MNDITTARVCLLALTDEIKGLVDAKDETEVGVLPLFIIDSTYDGGIFPIDRFSRSKILTSANDLEMLVVTHLDGMARALTDTIYATQIKSKLTPFLVQLFKDPLVYHQDGNSDEADTGALMTTLPTFMQHVEGSILPVLEGLVGDAKILLVLLISKEFAGALERKLLQPSGGIATATNNNTGTAKWTSSSVAALEHDFRRVSGYLADLSELQSREPLLHISQLLMALGADSRSEASSMARELLGEAQLKVLLSLRSDW